jgi:myosin heavy subunit
MNNLLQNKSRSTLIVGTLFLLSLIGLIFFSASNSSNKKGFNQEKIRNETLLSEKLNLDKQISKNKDEMIELKGYNEQLNKNLSQVNESLSNKEKEIAKLSKDNKRVKSLQKQLADIRKSKSDLEKKIDALNLALNQLKNERTDLNDKLNVVQNENKKLIEQNQILQSMVANNYRIESLKKKNNQLTIKAKRTKKLFIGFDVPETNTSDINFKITTPKGKVLSGKNDGITYKITDGVQNLTASISNETITPMQLKRVEMTYLPNEKLIGGIYKIEIFSKESFVGSCQIRLK